jgi:hypothetical protein
MFRKIIVLSLLLTSCTSVKFEESYNKPTPLIQEKILNAFHVKVKEKKVATLKGESVQDPVLKNELVRQEYFINFNF